LGNIYKYRTKFATKSVGYAGVAKSLNVKAAILMLKQQLLGWKKEAAKNE